MGGAAPVIITVVAVAASVVASPVVGEGILAAMGTTAAEAGVSATTIGAAAIGGSTSAVNAAIQGKNIEGVLEAGAIGAASSAVGAEVSQAIGGSPLPGEGGDITPGGISNVTGQAGLGPVAGSTAGGASSSFTRSLLSGSNLEQAGKQAAIGGTTGLVTSGLQEGFQGAGLSPEEAKYTTSLAGPYLSQNIAGLFTPQRQASTVGGRGATSPDFGIATTGQPSPGSAALGQALGVYTGDISPPVTIGGEEGKSRPDVWNVASLKVKDETGSSA